MFGVTHFYCLPQVLLFYKTLPDHTNLAGTLAADRRGRVQLQIHVAIVSNMFVLLRQQDLPLWLRGVAGTYHR